MAKLTLSGVYKVYPGDVTAVEDIDLEIRDGEFLVLVGPSGCGKSTTLRMIAGLEEISRGTIAIGDRVVNAVPPKDRDIAMVFQSHALYPHMSVYDNMAFGLKLRKCKKAEIDRRVTDAAATLGLTDYLQRRPKALSGGQQQRVALGRAIVRQPAVFLFDEPLSDLDAKMRVQMRVEISRLHARLPTTMVYVTHDQAEAMTMGDRIVVMKDGVIQQAADPIRLYDQPANRFVASFIGTPPMNFFEGHIRRDDGLFFDGAGVRLPLLPAQAAALESQVDRPITLGLRPEDIRADDPGQTGDWARTTATIDVSEHMGAETYWHLRNGDHSFIARVDPHRRDAVGTTVPLMCHIAKAHYFDATSEATLV